MRQFFADQIDQLDLCLDQLAVRDRNFDRFALMLVDNVVELTLHQHAEDAAVLDYEWRRAGETRYDEKILAAARGREFRAKVRFARSTGLISEDLAASIQHLHAFRNRVYHAGLRHETILHSLAVFYFDNACALLAAFDPACWSSSSHDQISHRAHKYLGKTSMMNFREEVKVVWDRLRDVGASLGDTLVADLCSDLEKTIESVDHDINFLRENGQESATRQQVVIDSQAWKVAFTTEGKSFAAANSCPATTVGGYISWMKENFPCTVKDDPIPRWRSRLEELRRESDRHVGLRKYCEFMRQTEDVREALEKSAAQLDAHIQLQIDIARGK